MKCTTFFGRHRWGAWSRHLGGFEKTKSGKEFRRHCLKRECKVCGYQQDKWLQTIDVIKKTRKPAQSEIPPAKAFWLADGTEVGVIQGHQYSLEEITTYLEDKYGVMPQDQDPPHSKAISFVDTEKEK